MTNVATPFTGVSETSPKVIQERPSQEELPGRNEVTRESSRKDAFGSNQTSFFQYCG